MTRRGLVAAGVGALLAGAARAGADELASGRWLTVGMSTALTGPAQALGASVKAGVEACFALTNFREGGIHGRALRLVALDDAYEPARTAVNMRRLIDEGVFAILGNVGTPTAAVAVPIANEKKVPFFGAYTGAGLLRKTPPDRYVFNFRASYAQETAEMVRGLVHDLRIAPSQIAFFTQDDAYGDSGFHGAVAALRAGGFDRPERLPHGRYPRNTVDVEGALARILDPRISPRAVVMVGAYAPCAKFIRLAKRYGLRAIFTNVSFVGSEALAAALGADGEGVVVTQVVPHYDAELPALHEYRSQVTKADTNFASLEGFLAAKAFVEGLRCAGPGADRERFIDAMESGQALDLGLGERYAFSAPDHQLSDRVWPTRILNGRFHPMSSWAELSGGR